MPLSEAEYCLEYVKEIKYNKLFTLLTLKRSRNYLCKQKGFVKNSVHLSPHSCISTLVC